MKIINVTRVIKPKKVTVLSGQNNATEAATNRSLVNNPSCLEKYPWAPTAREKTPNAATAAAYIIWNASPWPRSPGLYTNIKGSVYRTRPNLTASIPVFIGGASAIAAAVKDVVQIGGVMRDNEQK